MIFFVCDDFFNYDYSRFYNKYSDKSNKTKCIYVIKYGIYFKNFIRNKSNTPTISSEQDIVNAGCKVLSELLKRNIIYYTVENNNLNQSIFISIDNKVDINEYLNPSEKGVAEWVAIHNKHAGASTRYLSMQCLYYAIRKGENVHGVIGIDLNNERIDSLENRILLAILGEMALSLENIKNMQEKNEAIYTMKKEQLY